MKLKEYLFIFFLNFSTILCQVEKSQFLGCFFESLNATDKDQIGLFYNANFDIDQCSRYCYFLNRVIFGMTDQGFCLCSNVNYDIYGVFDQELCRNPCRGSNNYTINDYKCGGNFVFVSFYRTCPAFTYGYNCNQFCFCRSSICEPLNGMCLEKGCLDGFRDSSFSESFSYCFTPNCGRLNGQCQTLCQSGSFSPMRMIQCNCTAGYALKLQTFSCEDRNECLDPEQEDCEVCVNTLGSFYCACKGGHRPFILDRQRKCEVPDSLKDPCYVCNSNQKCVLLLNRTVCVCPYGEISPGECFEKSHCSQMKYCHICEEIDNRIHCSCMKGYKLVDHFVCLDVNECENDPCTNCLNFPGSYLCQCRYGCKCTNGTEECLVNTVSQRNYKIYGGVMNSGTVPPILWEKPFEIGVFYEMKLTDLIKTQYFWRCPFDNFTSRGPVLKMQGRGKYIGIVECQVQFKHKNTKKTPKIKMRIVNPVYASFLGQPVMHRYVPERILIFVKSSRVSYISYLWKYNESSSPCHENLIDRINNLDRFQVKLNDTLYGLTYSNSSVIWPLANVSKYSIYSKAIDASGRVISCEMVTYVVQKSGLTDGNIVCRQNCNRTLDRHDAFELEHLNSVPENYFYFWNLTSAAFEYVIHGVNKPRFILEKNVYNSLISLRQNLIVKVTDLRNASLFTVHQYNFTAHKVYDYFPCTYQITSLTNQQNTKVVTSGEDQVSIECVLIGTRLCTADLYIGSCRSLAGLIWLYSDNQCSFAPLRPLLLYAPPFSHSFLCGYLVETETHTHVYKFYIPIRPKQPRVSWLKAAIASITTDATSYAKINLITKHFNLIIADSHNDFKFEANSEVVNMSKLLIKNLTAMIRTINNFHNIFTVLYCAVTITNQHQNFIPADLQPFNNNIEDLLKNDRKMIGNNETSLAKNTSMLSALNLYLKYISNYAWIFVRNVEKHARNKNVIEREVHDIVGVIGAINQFFTLLNRRNFTNRVFFSNYANYILYEDLSTTAIGEEIELDFFTDFGFIFKMNKSDHNFRMEIMEYKVYIKKDGNNYMYIRPIKIEYEDTDRKHSYKASNEDNEIIFKVEEEDARTHFRTKSNFSPIVAIRTNTIDLAPSIRLQVKLTTTMVEETSKVNNIFLYFFTCPTFVSYFTYEEFHYWCHLNYQSKLLFMKEGIDVAKFLVRYIKKLGDKVFFVLFLENLQGQIHLEISHIVDKLTCLTKERAQHWNNETCEIQNKELVTEKLVCRCKQSLMYAGYMVTLPVYFEINRQENEKDSNIGFRLMLGGWLVFAGILAYAFKNDFENSLMTVPIDLADNPPKAQFCYLLIVETGSMMNMGAYREIFVQLNGSTGDSVVCCLSCNIFQVLKRGQTNYFILRSSVSLGHVLILRLWHRGTDSVSNWFVNNIKVIDLQTQMTYYFICQGWVGTNNKRWRSSLISILQTIEEFELRQNLLPHNIIRTFQLRHRITSIFLMSSIKVFSRTDRAVLLLFIYLFFLASSTFPYSIKFTIRDFYTTYFGIAINQFYTSFVIVLTCVPISYGAEFILTMCKWSVGQLVIIKDSCLLNKTMLTSSHIDYSKVPWRVRQKILRPVFDIGKYYNFNAVKHNTRKFFKLLFIYKLVSPGFLFIFLVCFLLSVFTAQHFGKLRPDNAYKSTELFLLCLIFYFFVCHFLALMIELLVYTFVLRRENVSVKLNVSLLYNLCRQEYRNTFFLEEHCVLKRKSALDYTIPKRNQFISYTKKNSFHWRTKKVKELDFLVTCLICFFLLLAEYYDVSGNNSNIYSTNLNMIRTLNPNSLNTKISSKEDCFDWFRMVSYDEMYGEVIRKENYKNSANKYRIVYVQYDGEGYYETMQPEVQPRRNLSMQSTSNLTRTIIPRQTTSNIRPTTDTNGASMNGTKDDPTERLSPFEQILQTRNTDVYLVKPVCFRKIDGASDDYKMIFEDTITPSFESICTNFTKEATDAAFNEMLRESWLHRKIVGISVKFFLYTSNVNTYSVVTMGCKTHSGKGIEGSFKVVSANMYHQKDAKIIFVFFGIIFVLVSLAGLALVCKLYQNGFFVTFSNFRLTCNVALVVVGFMYLLFRFMEIIYCHQLSLYFQSKLNISHYLVMALIPDTLFSIFLFVTALKLFIFATYHMRLGQYYWNESLTDHLTYFCVVIVSILICLAKLFFCCFGHKTAFKGFWQAIASLTSIAFRSNLPSKHSHNPLECLLFVPLYFVAIVVFVMMKNLIFAHMCFKKEWRILKPYTSDLDAFENFI